MQEIYFNVIYLLITREHTKSTRKSVRIHRKNVIVLSSRERKTCSTSTQENRIGTYIV